MRKLISKIYIFGFISLMSNQMMAQTTDTTVPNIIPRYEIGVNGTAFFNQFINLNLSGKTDSNAISPETPYYLTAKFRVKKGAIRVGLGAALTIEKNSNGKTADSKTLTNNDYQLRLGYEKQKNVGKRFDLYYGIDLLAGINDRIISSNSGFDFVTLTDRTWTYGAAPVAGLRFRIMGNISLSTETAIRYRYSTFSESADFSKNTDFKETGREFKGHKIDFIAPKVIYVTILF
jgi:opacity protein-like surface antigen